MKQEERLLEFLRANNSINPLISWKQLGIYRLSAVVYNLRKKHTIITTRIEVTNTFNEKCSVAEYTLIE